MGLIVIGVRDVVNTVSNAKVAVVSKLTLE